MTHTEEVSTTFESKTPTEQMNGHSMFLDQLYILDCLFLEYVENIFIVVDIRTTKAIKTNNISSFIFVLIKNM